MLFKTRKARRREMLELIDVAIREFEKVHKDQTDERGMMHSLGMLDGLKLARRIIDNHI